MTIGWTLVRWAGGSGDSVVWLPEKPGVPERCICGATFEESTPADATWLRCTGGWLHTWRSVMAELEERLSVKIGESGGSISAAAEVTRDVFGYLATAPEAEPPESNKSGGSSVEPSWGHTLHTRDVPACLICGRIGHTSEDHE